MFHTTNVVKLIKYSKNLDGNLHKIEIFSYFCTEKSQKCAFLSANNKNSLKNSDYDKIRAN